jgi:hypothetical protein
VGILQYELHSAAHLWPRLLIGLGLSASHAGAVTSVASWIIIPAIPIGAFVAERLGHPNSTMVGSFLLTAAAIAALPSVGASFALVALCSARPPA